MSDDNIDLVNQTNILITIEKNYLILFLLDYLSIKPLEKKKEEDIYKLIEIIDIRFSALFSKLTQDFYDLNGYIIKIVKNISPELEEEINIFLKYVSENSNKISEVTKIYEKIIKIYYNLLDKKKLGEKLNEKYLKFKNDSKKFLFTLDKNTNDFLENFYENSKLKNQKELNNQLQQYIKSNVDLNKQQLIMISNLNKQVSELLKKNELYNDENKKLTQENLLLNEKNKELIKKCEEVYQENEKLLKDYDEIWNFFHSDDIY